MRILFLSYKFYPDIGGIENISEILCTSFTKAGHIVHLVTTSVDKYAKEFTFKVIRKPTYLTLLKEHAWADVVFENNPSLHLSWPAIFFNRPIVTSLQTWIQDTNGEIRWQDKLKLRWLKRSDTIISCSNSIRKKCWPTSIVIQNPYDDTLFRQIGSSKNNTFVFLGRLVSDKGADLAIKALKKLSESDNANQPTGKYTLTVIGEGPEKAALQKLTSDLALNDSVKFAGSMSGKELVTLLNQHKYILIPSKWEEPFGIVALEGMACGCIPIVSDGGGLPDAVGKAGLKFKRGDLNAFVTIIKNLITNQKLEQELRDESKVHLTQHTKSAVAQLYLNVIETTIKH